ncbi:MAG: calcium/sodium antiporter [Defluviitaleaceae bacterium]|nr:calcium/sodium antiporter [Defluviitaleaceae bacterium]
MNVVLTFFLLVLGLVLLIKGSDIFVDASAGIARNFKVPTLIIGLTVMAFGTSAPEAFIGARASLDGTAALAMGNVIGSDIFNLIFIIGIAALINPMNIRFKEIARDYWVAISGPLILLTMMLFFDDVIPRIGGAFFLILFFIYVFVVVKEALKNRKEALVEKNVEEEIRPLKWNVLLSVLGLALIILGGELTVHHAVAISELLGMSARLVGLTIVAIGTSLPELTIVLMAAKRGENELAVGNIIGSSIFNIMFVLGLSGVIAPLPIEVGLIFDIAFLLVGSLIFLLFILTKKRLSRIEGAIMVLMYVAYLSYVVFT